ncbi:MAG: hypothetical protein JO292_04605 [Betaproteobacteria bacterium]|nr:hypothetical protein [Betaproteobacteria bacterium]
MKLPLFSFLALLLLSLPTQAQMYTWREGASKKVSNVPPGWYRFDRPVPGPRVVVTQGKRVLDDTGLSMEERLRMRPVPRPTARKN